MVYYSMSKTITRGRKTQTKTKRKPTADPTGAIYNKKIVSRKKRPATPPVISKPSLMKLKLRAARHKIGQAARAVLHVGLYPIEALLGILARMTAPKFTLGRGVHPRKVGTR